MPVRVEGTGIGTIQAPDAHIFAPLRPIRVTLARRTLRDQLARVCRVLDIAGILSRRWRLVSRKGARTALGWRAAAMSALPSRATMRREMAACAARIPLARADRYEASREGNVRHTMVPWLLLTRWT
jgi:hypothetical protein